MVMSYHVGTSARAAHALNRGAISPASWSKSFQSRLQNGHSPFILQYCGVGGGSITALYVAEKLNPKKQSFGSCDWIQC